MKTLRKLTTLALLILGAVGAMAQGTVTTAISIGPNQLPYALRSASGHTGGTGLTYKWIRNGVDLPESNQASWEVPVTDYPAEGGSISITYVRASKCNECDDWLYANPITVNICVSEQPTVVSYTDTLVYTIQGYNTQAPIMPASILTATPSSGAAIRWYNEKIGGSLVLNAQSYPESTVPEGAWAEAYVATNGCRSERVFARKAYHYLYPSRGEGVVSNVNSWYTVALKGSNATNGKYKYELQGASGGNGLDATYSRGTGGKGGYISTWGKLDANTTYYLRVGQCGANGGGSAADLVGNAVQQFDGGGSGNNARAASGGQGNGGNGKNGAVGEGGGGGGGATSIRTLNTNDAAGSNSRIIVAGGGGGGGSAAANAGGNGGYPNGGDGHAITTGARTATTMGAGAVGATGGAAATNGAGAGGNATAGGFGGNYTLTTANYTAAGGGAGYAGGGAGGTTGANTGGGGGGSSWYDSNIMTLIYATPGEWQPNTTAAADLRGVDKGNGWIRITPIP